MKTVMNIACILVAGIGLGFVFRAMRTPDAANGPGPGEVVFTNEGAGDNSLDPAEVDNSVPTHPPEDEAWLSRFELTERSGRLVRSEELKGQPYVVSFFFSTCPASCVQQNQTIKQLQEEFEGEGVRFVAISVDPETDTPEQLTEYAARFGADKDQWLFMTGDLTYIRRIGAEIFRLPVDLKFHTDRFVLVDAKGEIEGFYNWPEKMQLNKLRDKIREMIDSKES